MNDTITLKVEAEGLEDIERRVAALHTQWGEITAMAREHKQVPLAVAQLERRELGAFDTLILSVPGVLSKEQKEEMVNEVRAALGRHVRVFVLAGGAKASVAAGVAD